jgi:CIC family chloride channel protein
MKNRSIKQFPFYGLSILVGIIGGLGAVVFRGLIAFFHNLLFLGKFSFIYDANQHTPASPWGALVIFVPIIGAIIVVFLVKNYAPEAKGHGVPEVMDAVYYNKGIIRPVVAVIKSLASAISIGSGGAVGREGPIIQIGSTFGSVLGQIISMPEWQRITLIAAGAGAGIAATFNTPIGGILFAIEIMVHEISVRTLVPITLASATATYIGRIFFGNHPSFIIPTFEVPYFHITNPKVLIFYVALGILIGIVSAIYIRSIYAFEDFFEEHINNQYIRHMVGMFLVGVTFYLLMVTSGHYYIEGVGYATIQDILMGRLPPAGFLVLLFVLKLLAVSLTLGSGASGGIFSPALFMGATLGGAVGLVLNNIFPGIGISAPAFAVAGMAGVVGGSTGAATAAIVMIFEMTLDYNTIIPITLTVALSSGIRRLITRQTIYTLKLARRGHLMPEALRADLSELKSIKGMMNTHLVWLPATTTLRQLSRIVASHPDSEDFLVEQDGKLLGIVSADKALDAWGSEGENVTLDQIISSDFILTQEDVTVFRLLSRMHEHNVSKAIVTKSPSSTAVDNIIGLVCQQQITASMMEVAAFFQQ